MRVQAGNASRGGGTKRIRSSVKKVKSVKELDPTGKQYKAMVRKSNAKRGAEGPKRGSR